MVRIKFAGRTIIIAAFFLIILTLTFCGHGFKVEEVVSAQEAVQECVDPVQDCNSPKYLGKKGSCACFSCQKSKPEDPLRVICLSKAEQIAQMFEAEERNNTFYHLTQNALNRASSVASFKQSMQSVDLDPNQLMIYDKNDPSGVFTADLNNFSPTTDWRYMDDSDNTKYFLFSTYGRGSVSSTTAFDQAVHADKKFFMMYGFQQFMGSYRTGVVPSHIYSPNSTRADTAVDFGMYKSYKYSSHAGYKFDFLGYSPYKPRDQVFNPSSLRDRFRLIYGTEFNLFQPRQDSFTPIHRIHQTWSF